MLRRLATLSVLAGVWFLATCSFATAASQEEIDALNAQPCPAPYGGIQQRTYTAGERAAALNGDFAVFPPYRAHLVPPADWGQDPIESVEYRGRLHELAWLDALFYTYRHSHDLHALADARDLALDWIEHHPPVGLNPDAWRQRATGLRGSYLVYAARAAACEGLLRDSQASTLIDSLKEHASWYLGHHSRTHRGLMMDMSQWLIGDQLPFELEAQQWEDLAFARSHETIDALLGGDGIWREHSSHYHLLALELVQRLIELTGATDLEDEVDLMKAVSAWLVEPDGYLVQWGDTHLGPPPDEIAELVADQQGLSPTRGSGMAFVRDSSRWLGVTAGFYNPSHKHADDGSFDLFEAGHRIIADSGRYGYDPGPERSFAVSSQAHSVLLADAQDVERLDRYGSAITATGAGGGWYAVQVEDPPLERQGVTHRRIFLYRPGLALVLVDKVRSAHRHRYERLFQLGPEIAAEPTGARRVHIEAGGFAGSIKDSTVGTVVEQQLVKGQEDPLQGFNFPGFRVEEPRWTVILDSERVRNADFAATLGLQCDCSLAARIVPSSRGTKVELSLGGAVLYRLRVVRDGQTLDVDVLG